MSCPHKFHEYLNLERVDFVPETLIVGTFNPSWPEGNYAEWFYGRTNNNYFWDVLPRLYQPDLNLRNNGSTHHDWKNFCSENQVAITDLITCISDADFDNPAHQEALKSYSDASILTNFFQIEFTDIIGILRRFPTINNVYLTTQANIEVLNQRWIEVENYGELEGIYVKRLLTPSASARFQMGNYRTLNPDDPTPLRNFIFQNWLDVWHF